MPETTLDLRSQRVLETMRTRYSATSAHSQTMFPLWRWKNTTHGAEKLEEEESEGESSPPKQVFAAIAGLDDENEEEDSEKTPPRVGIPDPELPDVPPRIRTRRTDQPPGRSLNFQENIADETLMHIEGEDRENVKHKEILTNPITGEEVVDPEAFEVRRKELLAEAQNLVKVNASILKDNAATIKEYEQARAHQRHAHESLQKSIDLKAQWETQIKRTAHPRGRKAKYDEAERCHPPS
jgi:hypothetical protein